MGVNCCSYEKESPEIVIQKPVKNINTANKNPDISQNQNDLIVVNSTQNSQNLRSSSPEYEQKYQSYENTQSMSPQYNVNYQSFESQYSPQVNQSTGRIIPIDESNNIVYESQNLNQDTNLNIQTQNIVSQNENIITNNQSSIVFPQQMFNSTQGFLDSNQNQINPQVSSQVITVSQNINNQYVNEPFKSDLFTNDNLNTYNNSLGFNQNGIGNIFDSRIPENAATSNSQNINNQQSDTNVNFDELLKQQIGQQQTSNDGNGLNIDELLKQQNYQQQSGTVGTSININDLLNSQNNQQTGMGLNMDELLKQQNNQKNDLYFENQNDLNKISKSMQLPSPNSFQKNIIQKDPLLYSLNPPKQENISTSYQPDQYSPINSTIKNVISEPLSPSNQYNNIQQII